MSTTTPSAPADECDGKGFDTGAPVKIGQNRWYFRDGSYSSHNGFQEIRVPPPAHQIDLLCVLRCYHEAKRRHAESQHRALLSWTRGGAPVEWNAGMHGPQPALSDEYRALDWSERGSAHGLVACARPGLARLEAIAKHHASQVSEIEARLHAMGVTDPSLRDV